MDEKKGRCEHGKEEVLEVEFKLGAHSAHAFAHTGAVEGGWKHCDPPNTTGLENIDKLRSSCISVGFQPQW